MPAYNDWGGQAARQAQAMRSTPSMPRASTPPLQRSKTGGTKTTDQHYALKLGAYNRAKRRAMEKARQAARKNKLKQQGGNPTQAFLDSQAILDAMRPQPPVLPPIIDPTQQVLAGLGRDVKGARGATEQEFREAQKALGNIAGDPSVAGASTQDVYMGGLSEISQGQNALGTEISAEFGEFVLKQMQDRLAAQQQYQQDVQRFEQGLLPSPTEVAQFASLGALDVLKKLMNDPYGRAQALASISGSGKEQLSDSLKLDLEDAGVDWRTFEGSKLDAMRLVRQNKKTGGVSDAEFRRLLEQAIK